MVVAGREIVEQEVVGDKERRYIVAGAVEEGTNVVAEEVDEEAVMKEMQWSLVQTTVTPYRKP